MHFAWAAYASDMVEGPGADFLRGVALWSIGSSGLTIKMILRERCSTSHDLLACAVLQTDGDGMEKSQTALDR